MNEAVYNSYKAALDPKFSTERALYRAITATNRLWNLLVEQQRIVSERLRYVPKEDRASVLYKILTVWRGGDQSWSEIRARQAKKVDSLAVAKGWSIEEIRDRKKINPYRHLWNTIALQVTELKEADEEGLFSVPPAISLRAVVQNFERSMKQFWNGTARFPRYHNVRRGGGFKFFGTIDICLRHGRPYGIIIPSIGFVKLKPSAGKEGQNLDRALDRAEHTGITKAVYGRDVENRRIKIRSASVTYDTHDWYISFAVEERCASVETSDLSVYVHLGLKNLAYILRDIGGQRTMEIIPHPRLYEASLKRLRRLHRRVSRRTKGGSNRRKAVGDLSRLYRALADQRKRLSHSLTNAILKDSPARVVIQDWDVKGMLQQRRYSRLIADSAWGMISQQIAYKVKRIGAELIIVPVEVKVSKTCSVCDAIDEDFPLGQDIYKCCVCGAKIDREQNALQNLVQFSEN